LAAEAGKANEEFTNLTNALSAHNSSLDAFDELTKGTVEWSNALTAANEQVLDLLDKYPELADYVSTNENGVLEISDAG
jgi:hypothetical protein